MHLNAVVTMRVHLVASLVGKREYHVTSENVENSFRAGLMFKTVKNFPHGEGCSWQEGLPFRPRKHPLATARAQSRDLQLMILSMLFPGFFGSLKSTSSRFEQAKRPLRYI